MRALFLAALLIASTLAGCLAANDPTPGAAAPDAPADGPLDLVTDVEGCIEVLVLVLVEPDHARSLLPPGFEPADAAVFFGSPVPAGRAMVSINAIRCDGSALEDGPAAFADLIVPVDPPQVEGARVEDALRGAYSVHEYVSGAGLIEATADTGYVASRIAIEAEFGPAPGGAVMTGTGVLSDDQGELARFEVTAAPGATDTATANLFQLTPTGLVVHAYAWQDAPMSVGTATCTLRAGSLVAEVMGTTTCQGVETAGVLMGPFDGEARFQYFPGAGVREGAR